MMMRPLRMSGERDLKQTKKVWNDSWAPGLAWLGSRFDSARGLTWLELWLDSFRSQTSC